MQRESLRPSGAPASLPELYPIVVDRTEPPGRTFHRELRPGESAYVLKAHRLAWAWCRNAYAAEPAAFDAVRPRALVSALAQTELPNDLLVALTKVGRILGGRRLDPHRLALACLDVGDCAMGRGARQTALLWNETAAVVVSANPRFSWIVGKLHRNSGNCRDAEFWLHRAERAAVRLDDRYTQALALNSLANLHRQKGNYALARSLLNRALMRARRHGLRPLDAEILHDLLVLAVIGGEYREAEKYGVLALEKYGDTHPNLIKLACDMSYSWTEQGFFERALGVYESLLPNFQAPIDRLRVLAAMVRCAGATGKRDLFDRYWSEAWEITQIPLPNTAIASALVDLGKGALSICDWERASEALNWAVQKGKESGETDMLVAAEDALGCVARHSRLDRDPRHARENTESEKIAHDLRKRLNAYRTAVGPRIGSGENRAPGSRRPDAL